MGRVLSMATATLTLMVMNTAITLDRETQAQAG